MKLIIDKKDKVITYNIYFNNLTDLYDYVKSNQKKNTKIFHSPISNLDTPESCKKIGEPLDNALENLMTSNSENLNNFLLDSIKMNKLFDEYNYDCHIKRGLFGGVPIPGLVAAGTKDSMMHYNRDCSSSIHNVYLYLPCVHDMSNSQMINRGLITIYLVKALEQRGELVNFKLINLICQKPKSTTTITEYVNIELILKRPGEQFLDVEKCFYALTNIAFIRRIMFSILETIPLTLEQWQDNYGQIIEEQELKEYLKITNKDILIYNPKSSNLQIKGNDIYIDTYNTINNLGLEKEFDMEGIKRLIKK